MSFPFHYVSDYLLQNKTVSLEKIGVLDLNEKDDDRIFQYSKKAETSPELIPFLCEKMGKPISLVQQDLEYYLDQSRQLMNIRASSLVLNGLGRIYANNEGKYVFSSDTAATSKEAGSKTFDDVYAKSPLISAVNYAPRRNRKSLWRWVTAIVIIGAAIAYGAYYVHSSPSFFNDSRDSTIAKTDTTKKNGSVQNDAAANGSQAVLHTQNLKFILQSFPDFSSVMKRQTQLKSYGNNTYIDSADLNNAKVYRIYVIDSLATMSDTTHIKDSLEAYYGHPVLIDQFRK